MLTRHASESLKRGRTAVMLVALAGCAQAVPTCPLCTGAGGAWLPEQDLCVDTCEEQDVGVLCVESVCPGKAPKSIDDAASCEACILTGGSWQGDSGPCEETCDTTATCYTTRCPDGSG